MNKGKPGVPWMLDLRFGLDRWKFLTLRSTCVHTPPPLGSVNADAQTTYCPTMRQVHRKFYSRDITFTKCMQRGSILWVQPVHLV